MTGMHWFRSITAATALTTLAGCIVIDEDISVNRDGSADIALTYGMTDSALKRMDGMIEFARDSRLATGETNSIPFADEAFGPHIFDEEHVRKQFEDARKLGVTLTELNFTSRNAWQYVTLRCTLREFAAAEHIDILRAHNYSLKLTPTGNYAVSINIADKPERRIPTIRTGTQEYRDLLTIFQGFQFSLRVRVPTTIVAATTKRRTEYSATFDYDIKANPNALRDMQSIPIRVVFKGKDIDLADYP